MWDGGQSRGRKGAAFRASQMAREARIQTRTSSSASPLQPSVMSVTKVTPPKAVDTVARTAAPEGRLEGMSVTMAPAPPPKKTVKAQIASKFQGVRRLFSGLGKRAESAELSTVGPGRHPVPLPRMPDGTVNVEAIFDQTTLVKRLKRIADEFGKAEGQAVRFLEMTQQLPEVDSAVAAQVFVDAVRSEFTTGHVEHWLHTGSDVPDLDARLSAIKEKAQRPNADPRELKEEINALVDPLKAVQIQLVTSILLPALQAECR